MREVPDQTLVWDKKHAEGDHAALVNQPSPLCSLVEGYLPEHATIVEFGCGVGRDAERLANLGHLVLATDASEVVIAQNLHNYPQSHVKYQVLDLNQEEYGLGEGEYDAAYANLALHYFTDQKTRGIYAQIGRAIKVGGLFVFSCKSSDPYRTEGADIIEPHVYVAANGHALHTFSVAYAEELMESYEILHLDEVQEEYQGRVSGIVRCIARKKVASSNVEA